MYDEPSPASTRSRWARARTLIRQLNDTLGITSIVVSHDLEETFRIADQVIVLANGRIAAQGTPRRCASSTIRWCTSSCNALPKGRCTSTTRASVAGRFRRRAGR
jgi:phospholipid/cholesterol/gamma-HCH transport system ATP-binding protein